MPGTNGILSRSPHLTNGSKRTQIGSMQGACQQQRFSPEDESDMQSDVQCEYHWNLHSSTLAQDDHDLHKMCVIKVCLERWTCVSKHICHSFLAKACCGPGDKFEHATRTTAGLQLLLPGFCTLLLRWHPPLEFLVQQPQTSPLLSQCPACTADASLEHDARAIEGRSSHSCLNIMPCLVLDALTQLIGFALVEVRPTWTQG